MRHITLNAILMLDRDGRIGELAQHGQQGVNGNVVAISDIQNFSEGWSVENSKVGSNHIVNMGEIALLAPISKHHGLSTLQ